MVKIREAIVVEGRYDKNTVSQVIDAPIFETDGFGIRHNFRLMALLQEIARTRGLIVFTDSDWAGFRIRSFLKMAIPGKHLKHAYIPDIYGKERRKAAPGKEGKIGVEGMTPEVIIACLQRAGATFEEGTVRELGEPLTKTDMYFLGLSGRPDSKQKRLTLLKKLDFPEHMSSNALLQALNVLYTRDEIFEIVNSLQAGEQE